VTKQKRTMEHFSYGLERPNDLLSKLKWDAEKLTSSPHPYDVFNFMLTAAVLAEWIQNFYSSESTSEPFAVPTKTRRGWLLPSIAPQWITDTRCLPNPHNGVLRHIENALSICRHTANASKHFHWNDGGNVNAIGQEPQIRDWYSYLFTSTAPDLYLCFKNENYGLQQIKGIVLQFYAGQIAYLDSIATREENGEEKNGKMGSV